VRGSEQLERTLVQHLHFVQSHPDASAVPDSPPVRFRHPHRTFPCLSTTLFDILHADSSHRRLFQRPFAEGGMRYCLKMREFPTYTSESSGTPMVAKVFIDRKGRSMDDSAYFHEAMTQTVALSFASQFNKHAAKVTFPPCPYLCKLLLHSEGCWQLGGSRTGHGGQT
jgi:hypothetical protein